MSQNVDTDECGWRMCIRSSYGFETCLKKRKENFAPVSGSRRKSKTSPFIGKLFFFNSICYLSSIYCHCPVYRQCGFDIEDSGLGVLSAADGSPKLHIPSSWSRMFRFGTFGLVTQFVTVLPSTCQQIWKTQQWPQDWKIPFSFQSQRKAMPKNVQTTAQLHSSHMLVK